MNEAAGYHCSKMIENVPTTTVNVEHDSLVTDPHLYHHEEKD